MNHDVQAASGPVPLIVSRPVFRLVEWHRKPSAPLRFVGSYLVISGALSIAAAAVVGIAGALGWAPARAMLAQPLSIAIPLVTAVGTLWSGTLLRQGERLSARLALPALRLPLLGRLLDQPISGGNLAFSVVGLVVLAASWRALR